MNSNGIPVNETRCFSAKDGDDDTSSFDSETLSGFEGEGRYLNDVRMEGGGEGVQKYQNFEDKQLKKFEQGGGAKSPRILWTSFKDGP